jgi:CHASE3 domain sensor protein
MTIRQNALSVIANRTIGTKIATGFACVLAILAVVSGTSYFSFHTASEGFATYA